MDRRRPAAAPRPRPKPMPSLPGCMCKGLTMLSRAPPPAPPVLLLVLVLLVLLLLLLPKPEGRRRVEEEDACLRGVERAEDGPPSPCPCCPTKSPIPSAM